MIFMSREQRTSESKRHFYLNKWYLDFIGEDGIAMIFYSAELVWRGFRIPYSSWLHCDRTGKIKRKSRYRQRFLPDKKNTEIHWVDPKFGISGIWKNASLPVSARIYESDEGELDWQCYQPASDVTLNINGQSYQGEGYAEQILLTVPVWKIPMDKLRWGHVVSDNYALVWIELLGKIPRQWIWLNGEQIYNCTIGDQLLVIPDKNMSIHLDRSITLESEKKILSIVEKLMKYIPGLKNNVPLHFLLADESKWFSQCTINIGNDFVEKGMAIHEYVDFNPSGA